MVPPPANTRGADLDFCLLGTMSLRPLSTHSAVQPEKGAWVQENARKSLSPSLRNAFGVLNLSLVQSCVNQAKGIPTSPDMGSMSQSFALPWI